MQYSAAIYATIGGGYIPYSGRDGWANLPILALCVLETHLTYVALTHDNSRLSRQKYQGAMYSTFAKMGGGSL